MPDILSFPQPAVARQAKRRILNGATLKALKPPPAGSVDFFDDATPGLSLRVTANDVRTWTVFYRDKNARQEQLTLGRYPAVALADARELARDPQLKVAKGGDPVADKRAARDVLTFGELAQQYIENHAKPNKRSWAEDQRQLDSSLTPKWGNRPAAELTAEDLLALLNAKVRAGAPVAANRLRALVSRVYTFGAEQRLLPPSANPVIGVKKPTKETSRERVLTDDEIRRLWEACATQNPYVVVRGFGQDQFRPVRRHGGTGTTGGAARQRVPLAGCRINEPQLRNRSGRRLQRHDQMPAIGHPCERRHLIRRSSRSKSCGSAHEDASTDLTLMSMIDRVGLCRP